MKTTTAAILIALLLVACASQVVKRGDYVLVTYAGTYPNGTIFDTNNPKLQSQFPADVSHFSSLPVHVGTGDVIPGFDNALIGMKVGETKSVTIKATQAYGGYDASKVLTLPKRVAYPLRSTFNRTVVVSKTDFLQQAGATNVTIGQTFNTQNFLYNVTAVNDTSISLYIVKPTEEPISVQDVPWNSTLVTTTPTEFVYKNMINENATYNTKYGPMTAHLNSTDALLTTAFYVGEQFQTPEGIGRVTKETADTITIDFNHPLAGYDLTFNITVNSIQSKG